MRLRRNRDLLTLKNTFTRIWLMCCVIPVSSLCIKISTVYSWWIWMLYFRKKILRMMIPIPLQCSMFTCLTDTDTQDHRPPRISRADFRYLPCFKYMPGLKTQLGRAKLEPGVPVRDLELSTGDREVSRHRGERREQVLRGRYRQPGLPASVQPKRVRAGGRFIIRG